MFLSMQRSVAVVVLALCVLGASTGCVQRNVDRINGEEADTIPPPPPPQAAGAQAAGEAEATTRIAGVVELSPEIAGSVPAGSVLYLIVRVAGREGGAPLAVQQIATPTFPFSFEITERDSMIEGTPLIGEMSVTARVDQDGNAFTSTPGDLSGVTSPVVAGDDDIVVVLDQRVTGETGS